MTSFLRPPLEIEDPGQIPVIEITKFGTMVNLEETSGSSEVRTLLDPEEAGLIACLRYASQDGVATEIEVTAESPLDITRGVSPEERDVATFTTVGQQLWLISIPYGEGYRWQIFNNYGPSNEHPLRSLRPTFSGAPA